MFLRPGFTLIAVLLHPKSRGRITLNSRYVEDQPVIEPNYFSHPEDVKTLISGIRLTKRMGVSGPYKVNCETLGVIGTVEKVQLHQS